MQKFYATFKEVPEKEIATFPTERERYLKKKYSNWAVILAGMVKFRKFK